MNYVIAPNGVFSSQVNDTNGNYAWDENNFCTPSALTPDQMIQYGVAPLISANPPTYNQYTQQVDPADPVLIDGVWTQQYVVVNLPLDTAKSNLLAQLDTQRLIQQSAGLPYTFPDSTGTIQTRDPLKYPDLLNVNGTISAAIILQAQGITASILTFRDLQNVNHNLTPAQALAMGMAVNQYVAGLYGKKWNIQIAINALTADTINAFDITQGW